MQNGKATTKVDMGERGDGWNKIANVSVRVSIQGVKSLWGDHIVFPRLGAGDTDRWPINLCLCTTCQCTEVGRAILIHFQKIFLS